MIDHPTLRNNKLKIALIDKNGKVAKVHEVMLKAFEITELEIDNKLYYAILPNYEDWAFIKVILDKDS